VADPGFDLGCGGGVRKSLKMLKVEVKVILACFGHISIKIKLKKIASEEKNEKT